ncbi:hypothetical protein [Nodularia spumigena]|uniref:hypothetical protein n=1 Tax=Nodularia spumigena TaxID=70799 RepID=UPI00232BC0FE|nr:hypothetical protein [Nodularia spumigena]MDB9318205.1 hypothetical protein [Nodularia spumigena CS-590/01A]MDB9328030.1 hypothetical protein [Nodularia spumigena CS-590/02]MDB9334315.1 hypothetical protein [Nodularia spumigena CS-590/01]
MGVYLWLVLSFLSFVNTQNLPDWGQAAHTALSLSSYKLLCLLFYFTLNSPGARYKLKAIVTSDRHIKFHGKQVS